MSLLKRTTSNLIWIIFSDISTKLTTLIATIFLARQLGVESFGIFSLSVVVASTIWPIVDMGVSGYGTREIAKNKRHAPFLYSTLNSMRLIVSILISLITVLVITLIEIPETKAIAISLGLLYLIGYALCPDWVVRGLEEMSLLFIINVTTSIFFIVSILIFVSTPEDTYISCLLRAISFSFGSIAGVYALMKRKSLMFHITVNVSELIEAIGNTKHFLTNRIITNISQFVSFYLVAYYLSDTEMGLFAAPHRLYLVVYGGISAIASAIFPILSDLYQNNPEQFRKYQHKIIIYLIYIFVPMSLICLIYSAEIIEFILGSEYNESNVTLSIMLFTAPIVMAKSIYTFTLSSGGFEKHIFRAVLYGMFCQLISAGALIPLYGINGAALSIMIGELAAATIIINKCYYLLNTHRFLSVKALLLLLLSAILSLLYLNYDFGAIEYLLLVFLSNIILAISLNVLHLGKLKSFISKDLFR